MLKSVVKVHRVSIFNMSLFYRLTGSTIKLNQKNRTLYVGMVLGLYHNKVWPNKNSRTMAWF